MTGLDKLIADLKTAHAARNPRSEAAFERALAVMPGGNSRTQLYFEPFPFYVDRAEGAYLHDLDGHRYLDVVNNYTSLIHGHPDAETVRVIAEQAARGTAHAAPSPSEIELAEEITSRVTSMEKVRFTNSGSEAVLYAIRLARHATGRPDVIKVEGGYHGGNESVQVSVKRLGADQPAALPEEGVPESVASATHVIPFDDIDEAVRLVGEHGATSAALIVEPIQGFGGGLRPPEGYLEAISKAAADTGTLVILDEIQTLRYAYGGIQQTLGLTPDLTVLGKLIGGGLPVGAFGGSEELMAMTDPRGNQVMTQSGTFNANPLTMAAGVHAVRKLTPKAIERLNANGDELRAWINEECARLGLPLIAGGYGSLLQLHVGSDLPTSYRQAKTLTTQPLTALFYLFMERGVFTAPSRVIMALSTAMSDAHLDELRQATASSLDVLSEVMSI
ncbi:MAG: aspartate aminotransferase family protein [bacterium]|nr:aspartate aminotransferase family protein [Acidimicrobiia bacterium]MCY4650036.1 aspartate aminotransferase family protein [bacterium]